MKLVTRKVRDPLGDGYIDVVLESNLFDSSKLMKRGKVRDIYDLGEYLYIFSTDRISSFDCVLPTPIPHKGTSLHALSVYWFEKSKQVFPNHFVESVDSRTMKVFKAERIDIEWVVRGYMYGSMWRAYEKGERTFSGVKLENGIRLAEKLPSPILTPTTKSDVGHDVETSREEAIEKGIVTREEWEILEDASLKLYEFYSKHAKSRGIILADVKFEFGRWRGELIQIDEAPTHDSARLWDASRYVVGRKQEASCLDKEFLREYLRRAGFTGEGEPPDLPWLVVAEVSKRCFGAYRVLIGDGKISDFKLKTLDELMSELT